MALRCGRANQVVCVTAFWPARYQRNWPVLARMMPVVEGKVAWMCVTRDMAEPALMPPRPPMMRWAKMPRSWVCS